MDTNGTLTPKQQRLIAAMLAEPTTAAALAAAGLGAATLSRWRREPAFVQALDTARRELFQSGYDALLSYQTTNLATLAGLRDGADNENTRLRAAVALEQSLVRRFELLTLGDLERRISALEGRQP
jgi:hypothetical protein